MGLAAVGALGTIAGAAAGKAIQGPTHNFGPDTSIPGISSATIKQGGKGGKGEVKVPQIDISQSLKWFQEAADTQTKYYQDGLDYYQKSLAVAAATINDAYTKADNTLQPLSYSSNQALNEQMRMMGLDPIQAGHGLGDQLKSSFKVAQDLVPTSGASFVNDLSSKLDQSLTIKDAAERATTKQSILDQASSGAAGVQQGIQSQIDALNAQQIAAPNPNSPKYAYTGNLQDYQNVTGEFGMSDADARMRTPAYQADLAAFNQQNASRNASLASLQGQLNEWNAFSTGDLAGVVGDFKTQYGDYYDKAYTGDEVAAKVAATPGYQFQMDQGTQALERQGAAKGMLGSGNTATALVNYGQQLGQNFYGMYMQNLSNIVSEGSGATGQIAANQINQGKDYGALIEAGGNAGMQTQQLIGNAKAQSLYASGNLYADAAKFNATMQYQGINAEKDRAAAAQGAAIQASAGIMNAGTQQQQFNYGVFQGQQAGTAYANSGGGGWPQYNPTTNNWSV